MRDKGPDSDRADPTVYIGVGSNLAPTRHILQGVSLLRVRLCITGASRFYRNPAVHPCQRPESQPPFVNGVIRARTPLPPGDLKRRVLCAVEEACGRVRTQDRYAPRTLDLDLLAYGNLAIRTEALELPDPDVFVHAFLAVPMAELAGSWIPPGAVHPMREIARRLDNDSLVEEIALTRAVRRLVFGIGVP